MQQEVDLTFELVDEILKCVHIKTKATKQHFPVVLFNMQCNMALNFESVDEILKSGHSNECYIEQYFPAVLFKGGPNY